MVGHISPQLLVKPHQSITNSSRSQDDGHQKNIELSDNDNVVAGLETAAKMVGKFEIKVKPDNNTFFTLIRAFLHQKQPHVALNLYEEMLELGVVPSTVTTAMLADGLEWCGEAKAADNIMMYRNIRVKRLERESAESNRGLADD
ncbi:hypothetical protein H4219_000309 [Mycoemilia scoparia]|uniref:Pentatricopeptide repeat-containing protein n=1 Tax=Mycoemilia scoparia TaxID=417184 RepID=A0A9W8AB54_9FUNG|nr:hypothetical protein H4219_000309 [Mycoemilia scoparia]